MNRDLRGKNKSVMQRTKNPGKNIPSKGTASVASRGWGGPLYSKKRKGQSMERGLVSKESVAGLGWRSELESGYSRTTCCISTLGFTEKLQEAKGRFEQRAEG